MRCANCKKTRKKSFRTAYGDYLCEDCWDNYICTETGMLEYFIGFCKEDYHPDEFDADFVGSVIRSYQINYTKLDFTEEQRLKLEKKAKELGLL